MSQSLTGVKEVPRIAWLYWDHWKFTEEQPGLYGLDKMRSEYHEELCEHYKISQESSRAVTDHLNKYQDVVEMHFALKDLQAQTGQLI